MVLYCSLGTIVQLDGFSMGYEVAITTMNSQSSTYLRLPRPEVPSQVKTNPDTFTNGKK